MNQITQMLLVYGQVPGCPAAGHLGNGQFWHPGSPDRCPKCKPKEKITNDRAR